MKSILQRSLRKHLLTSVAATATLIGSGAASAQDADSDDGFALEEIIVTASKRQQTLQETPIAVSVTGADTIEKARVLDISDLQTVVPSLRVTTLQTSSNTNFVIRGFGNGANNAGIEPSVGVFIDGVYRSRSAAAIGDLPRLQRVEVLRGPQSTLFGKNASAGVISVVTAAPSYDPEGRVEVQYGNYDQRILKGYFTGGLSETFAMSFSGSVNKRDGYIESTEPGIPDLNDRDRWNLRTQALWEPSDDVTFRLIADYSEIDEICCGVTNIINGPTAGIIQALGGAVLDDASPFAYVSPINEIPINEIEDGGVSLQADIDFENFSLTSISSYRSNDSLNDTEPDYTGLEILDSAFNEANIDTYTQEIRLTSTGDNDVDWMIGGFYFNEDITQVQGLEYGDAARAYISGVYSGFLGGAPDPFLFDSPDFLGFGVPLETILGIPFGSAFNGDTVTRETFTQDNEAYSLFATVDIHVNDRLTLTGGLNYTNDKKRVTGSTVNGDTFSSVDAGAAFFNAAFFGATGLPATPENIAFIESVAPGTSDAVTAGVAPLIGLTQAFQFQPQFLAFPNSVQDGRSNDDKLTWTARLAYDWTDNVNVYFNVSTGYKATSWNLSRDARPFAANQAALEAAGLTQVNQAFGTLFAGPEEATVYELGLKARFNRGAFNIAIFDQTLEGFQSNIFQGSGFVLSNAGEQNTKGVEVDMTWTPIDELTLTFAGTYLDPEFVDFQNAPGPGGTVIDASGTRPAGIHEFSITTSATYNHQFESGAYGFIRADYIHESDVQVVDNIPGINREVNVFNASAGIEFENGFGVSVWGRNLFNDEFFLSAFPGVIQGGTFNGYANTPRLWGFSVSYEF
ncbi:MAG: TonB-dependent receptor [Kordiimonadaceae bacterium]|nr:TonB-dependent receptor [Kordiimonadaceae bacterium]MBO6568560.1 TonB-dependent receptor [Kordiimonadaceae bacterium]MBO6963711.1 TonB-dependent receptor [Kordiimonadaceae bacterium]